MDGDQSVLLWVAVVLLQAMCRSKPTATIGQQSTHINCIKTKTSPVRPGYLAGFVELLFHPGDRHRHRWSGQTHGPPGEPWSCRRRGTGSIPRESAQGAAESGPPGPVLTQTESTYTQTPSKTRIIRLLSYLGIFLLSHIWCLAYICSCYHGRRILI